MSLPLTIILSMLAGAFLIILLLYLFMKGMGDA